MSSTSEILNIKTFVALKQLMELVRVCLGLLGLICTGFGAPLPPPASHTMVCNFDQKVLDAPQPTQLLGSSLTFALLGGLLFELSI